jgi:hypothetical protein
MLLHFLGKGQIGKKERMLKQQNTRRNGGQKLNRVEM